MSDQPDESDKSPLGDLPPGVREIAFPLLSEVLNRMADMLAKRALDMASLGGGVATHVCLGTKDEKNMASVIVLSGEIPKDLIEGLDTHFRGLLQDLETGGKIKIHRKVDIRPGQSESKPNAPESTGS